MGKKIIAIIPARIGSKGIKYKNLKKVNGKSLVEICIKNAKNIKGVSKVAVSTDSKKIQNLSKKQGAWCEKLRPKNLSKKNSQTNLALLHTLKEINEEFDYVIELQPTYLFRRKKTLSKAINMLLKNKKYDSLISIIKIQDTSHPDYVIQKKDHQLKFKSSATNFNRHYLNARYKPIGLIIISKYENFIKKKDMLTGKILGIEITNKKEMHDINNPIDLKIAKLL
tara:strand:- start:756 stop:1430 length:675 start_codon:yes stop_codon:yes gene_type:complete